MLKARKVVADEESMKQARWTGDDATGNEIPPEDLAAKIRTALDERANQKIRKTHYDVIGVPYDATQKEIEAACVRLGDKYRPDRNPGDALAAQAFSEVEKAFEILGDAAKRVIYDASLRPR
jgi:hypothetical protein